MKTKTTRGGARKGAGRPKVHQGQTARFDVTMPTQLRDDLDMLKPVGCSRNQFIVDALRALVDAELK